MLQTERADMVTLRLPVCAPRFYPTGANIRTSRLRDTWRHAEVEDHVHRTESVIRTERGESCMKNRMQQFCTFGSVRGEAGAAMVTLNGHAAGNGGYGQGDTYGRDRTSPTRRYPGRALGWFASVSWRASRA